MVRLTNTYGVPAGSVVVGTDGSSWSQAALVVALDMAGSAGRPLTLIHVGDTDPSGQDVLTRARAEAARRAPELEIHAVLRAGDPREVLVASTEHAAVLVVGSRGRGPTRSLLLGSVSVAVTRRAHCPVVVVRPHHPGLVRQGVLVGADGSPESRPTLAFAFQQALSRRLPLTVLHAVEGSLDDPEEHRLLVAEAMAGLRESYPDVATRVAVIRGRAEDALVEESRRTNLLVLGSHRGGITQRSVSAAVVERARCPVAVVPMETPAAITHG